MTGVVVRCHARGFGFVCSDMFAGDVFFPAWAVDRGHGYAFDDLQPGMTVRFDLTFDDRNRPQARHVRIITEM
jgi:cold shock CspA family protein